MGNHALSPIDGTWRKRFDALFAATYPDLRAR